MSCRSYRAYITYTSSSQHIAITSRRNFSFPSFKLRLNTKTKLRSCLIKKIFKLRSCFSQEVVFQEKEVFLLSNVLGIKPHTVFTV